MSSRLPPHQQLIRSEQWPVVGEKAPAAGDPEWRLLLSGMVEIPQFFTLAMLKEIKRESFEVDIHCVTRWSKFDMQFEGLAVRHLLEAARPLAQASFVSFVARSTREHSSSLPLRDVLMLNAFVAWSANGVPLARHHGGPLRLVVPGRYFYKSVKWLERIELLEHDQLGYWEANSGYHNHADPWQEERYMAVAIGKQEAARLIASRNFEGRDLRSIHAADRDLDGLQATEALLRDADFRGARLGRADFSRANLCNAHFDGADLRGALFVDADIEGASFIGADLRGADLRVASMFGASFCQMDESGQVSEEALIDADTVMIPERFDTLADQQYAWIIRQLDR